MQVRVRQKWTRVRTPVQDQTRALQVMEKAHKNSISAFLHGTHTHTTVLRLCGICPGKPG